MMNETGSILNASGFGMKKFELQMIAFSVSEYLDELSISSTC